MKSIDMQELFRGWSLNQAVQQEVALIGRQYLGGELDWLREGELGWRSWDRDTLDCLFLCALSLSLGLQLGLLPCLSHLLLLGLVICCCGCLSLMIGLGSRMGSMSGMRCT